MRSTNHQIEAIQSGEVIFTIIGEVVILGEMLPTMIEFTGLALIIVGMILSSISSKATNPKQKNIAI
ncbi:MAG: multidrug resistance efflux transporter family protein [Bacillaceae bacterium]